MSAIDGSIKKKMLGSGVTTLIISNDEINDILKIVKSLENSGLVLKGVSETIQHEAKEQRGGLQAYDSVMCGYFCIGFINFMFNGKSLTDYTNLFPSNDFNKNDDIILKYFGLYDVK